MSVSGGRNVWLGVAIVFVLALAFPLFYPIGRASATAGSLQPRSLTLQANGSNGGSQPNVAVNNWFQFTTGSTASIGSIEFQYCTTAGGTCTGPSGLDTSSATLSGTQTGASGFTLSHVSANQVYITRTAASINSGTALAYTLLSVHNPTAANQVFYVHITTYTGTDGSTGPTDTGTVAASTANQIALSGTMPESLVFCTGGTVSTNGGVPDCTTATSGTVSFNQLFSPTDTAIATSQMAASTNASTGYVITVNGTTLTSGTNTITALSTGGGSTHGNSQFGLNLVSNTTPTVGTVVAPANNGSNYNGQPVSPNYGTQNSFRFATGEAVASSTAPSDAQIFTVAYIVNVNGAQAVGTYSSTLTYICTPTY